MKTLVVNQKNIRTRLPIFGFVLLASFVLAIVPALGTTEFEVGTQFGLSHIIPEGDESTTTVTYTRLPSSTFLDTSSAPTSLYATWFPSQQFGIGPEFSFGRFSVSEEYFGEREDVGITAFHLGVRAAFFPLNHLQSSPYVLGRVSTTLFSGDDLFLFDDIETLTGFGIGLGYQWRIGPAFVFRAEGQYQRLLLSGEEDDANEFSLILGIATRFGNSKSNTAEMPNAQ